MKLKRILIALLLLSGLAALPAAASAPASVPAPEAAWIGSLMFWARAPYNGNTSSSVAAWIARESGWNATPPDGAEFTWNPLNSTLKGFGSTRTVNKVGVRIYPTENLGVQATARTLQFPVYASLLSALRAGRSLCGPGFAAAFRAWSGGGYSQVC